MLLRARWCVVLIIFASALSRAVSTQSQVPAGSPSLASRPVSSASRITEAPSINGALDEGVWQTATPLTSFVQAEPFEGSPASENTEVRILYDDEAIYVGVVLHDSSPSTILTTDTRRDAELDEMDSFVMIFDTFRDRQNGFVFGTNAAGIQYDAQVRDQGEEEESWDGSWDVSTSITTTSWVAEFRIPLRTLRYGAAPQTWGVNFFRNIQRTRERTYWSPLPREHELSRLSSAGELRGLELKTPRNLKLLPFVVGAANRDFTAGARLERDYDIGFDTKFGITPGSNLDVTVNTDFAQVEVDTQQINLTRFNLRFPEKRPFFLENSGLFTVGKEEEIDLFFSRRIGLDENGLLVPINAGARFTGKVNGINVGVLNMQTDNVNLEPGNNFSVLRVSRELRNRSGVGAMFVNRSATGDLSRDGDWNRTWGVDGRLGIGESFTMAGFGARTETPGLTGRDFAYNMDSEYDDGTHRAGFEYGLTGETFNPEVGFLEKEDGYRRYHVRYHNTMRQQKIRDWGFREWQPHVQYTRFDYLDGGLQNAEFHLDNHWDWENGNRIDTALNGTWEGFREPFEIYPGVIVPVGEHGGFRFRLNSNTDQRKWISAEFEWDVGTFLTGTQNSPSLEVLIRDGGRFSVDTSWTYRSIDLPEGAFHTNLGNMRVTYNFTPSVFVQSLVQYNDRTERWSTNLRFHVLETAGTGLFVVYNNTESLEGLGPINRAFIVKYVRQFDLLR
jgi:hypothetical protein